MAYHCSPFFANFRRIVTSFSFANGLKHKDLLNTQICKPVKSTQSLLENVEATVRVQAVYKLHVR